MHYNKSFVNDDDMGIPRSANSTANASTEDKIRYTQNQVNEITNIMHQNIERALQRDVNLSHLENKTESLQINAEDFKTTSKKTHKHFLWKNRKWTLILLLVIAIIIAAIALGIGLGVTKKN